MNIVIPMAGLGKRFLSYCVNTPKPFLSVAGVPMIEAAIDSLRLPGQIFIISRKAQLNEYPMGREILERIKRKYSALVVIESDAPLAGPATTCLEALNYINNGEPLLIANCDQIMTWNSNAFLSTIQGSNSDGIIVTFKNELRDPAFSYVLLNETSGLVERVEEKVPISDICTMGLYYWKYGRDFISAVREMKNREDQVNGEYYVAPAYNYAIKNGCRVTTYTSQEFHLIGTPSDLRKYNEAHS